MRPQVVGAATELDAEHNILAVFALLAKRDLTRQGCSLHIPHTVVYQHGSLRAWYYWDSSQAEISKKDRKQCTKDEIYRVFSNVPSPTSHEPPCVATFMYKKCEFMEEASEKEAISVEFLSKEGLLSFLNKRERKPDGMLQQFIVPKSNMNGVVQVIWTPYLTLLNSRKNIHNLMDKRFSLYDRCVTHEGKSHLSTEVYSSPKLAERVDKVCETVQNHLVQMERRLLTRAVYYFKVDFNGDLYLMWAASMVLAKLNTQAAMDAYKSIQRPVERRGRAKQKQQVTKSQSASPKNASKEKPHREASPETPDSSKEARVKQFTSNISSASATTITSNKSMNPSAAALSAILHHSSVASSMLGAVSSQLDTSNITTSTASSKKSNIHLTAVQKRILLNLSPAYTSPMMILRNQQLGLESKDAEVYCVVPESTEDLLNNTRMIRFSSHDEIAAGAHLAMQAAKEIPPQSITFNHQRWAKIKRLVGEKPLSPVTKEESPIKADIVDFGYLERTGHNGTRELRLAEPIPHTKKVILDTSPKASRRRISYMRPRSAMARLTNVKAQDGNSNQRPRSALTLRLEPGVRYCRGGGGGLFQFDPHKQTQESASFRTGRSESRVRMGESSHVEFTDTMEEDDSTDSGGDSDSSEMSSNDGRRQSLQTMKSYRISRDSSASFQNMPIIRNSSSKLEQMSHSLREKRKSLRYTTSHSQSVIREDVMAGKSTLWDLVGDVDLRIRVVTSRDLHNKTQDWITDFLYELYSASFSTLSVYSFKLPPDVHKWVGDGLESIFEKFGVDDIGDNCYEFCTTTQVGSLRKYMQLYQVLLTKLFFGQEKQILELIKRDASLLMNNPDANTRILSPAYIHGSATRWMDEYEKVALEANGPIDRKEIVGLMWKKVLQKIIALCDGHIEKSTEECEASIKSKQVVSTPRMKLNTAELKKALQSEVEELPSPPGPLRLAF